MPSEPKRGMLLKNGICTYFRNELHTESGRSPGMFAALALIRDFFAKWS